MLVLPLRFVKCKKSLKNAPFLIYTKNESFAVVLYLAYDNFNNHLKRHSHYRLKMFSGYFEMECPYW